MDSLNKVTCCFCGEPLSINDALVIIIKPNIEHEEAQELFCHTKHLLEKLDKRIPLHPDFFAGSNSTNIKRSKKDSK